MRVDEWLIPAGDARELTPAEIEEALTADPEVTLISDYLMRALTPEQAAEVERRLRDDADFRARVAPILDAWNAWPTVEEMTVPEEELSKSWQRFLAKAAWHGVDVSPPSGAHDDRAADERTVLRRIRRWQLAVLLLVAVGLPLSIGGGAWLGVALSRARHAPASRVHAVEASERESEQVSLDGNGVVSLSPGTRLTWSDSAENGMQALYLDGSAYFILRHRSTGQYEIVTTAARIIVTGTEFEVTVPDPRTTRVQVRSGTVLLYARGGRTGAPLELRAGDTGLATWGDAARRVQ